MSIFNARRLRDYPRLMFVTTWTILGLNLVFKQGWLGALGQIIGSDFITLYGAGLASRTDMPHLYDFTSQALIQESLIQPTQLPGVNPFISPPYVASIYSLFTYLPLPVAFIIWTVLSLLVTVIAVSLLLSIMPETTKSKLGFWQLLIIVASFFPFIEGLQVGQNHTLSLLIISGLFVFTLSQRWFLAGVMAGLLIYKPQMVLGFLIIWVIWRQYKALAGFVVISLLWVGTFFMVYGSSPYASYLSLSNDLFFLPYIPGFPGYLLLTIYGFFTTIFPIQALSILRPTILILSAILFLMLAWFAFRYRNKPILDQTPILVLALLLPLVATPYAMLHDLIILIPAFILWARYSSSRPLLYTAIAVYLGGFFLTLAAALTKIATVSLITIGLVVLIYLHIYRQQKEPITGDLT